MKILVCNWFYMIKLKDDGFIDRYKSRVVAKRYDQNDGVKLTETFSTSLKLQLWEWF